MKIYTAEVKIDHLEREIARLNLKERRREIERKIKEMEERNKWERVLLDAYDAGYIDSDTLLCFF